MNQSVKCRSLSFNNSNYIMCCNVPVLIRNKSLQLIMYSEPIPFDGHPKYLGVHLQKSEIYFQSPHEHNPAKMHQATQMPCLKNWAVSTNEQLTVYKLLIRSCMEYAAPLTILSNPNIRLLQGVQYQALRIILG